VVGGLKFWGFPLALVASLDGRDSLEGPGTPDSTGGIPRIAGRARTLNCQTSGAPGSCRVGHPLFEKGFVWLGFGLSQG